MKKVVAILLIIGLVLGSMTSAAFAKKTVNKLNTVNEATYSTYEFKYELPDYILADKDEIVGVTFQTKVKGVKGYDDVRFSIDSECIETEDKKDDGQVTFSAKDSKGNTAIIINGGTWGPDQGFNLPADYKETTEWTINFSKAGKYKISFGLIDENGDIIDEIEETVTVKVIDGTFKFELPKEVVEDEAVDLEVTLETEQNYDNDTRLEMQIEGPARVALEEIDTNNWKLTYDGGYWNTDIDDSYYKTTKWKATFPKEGNYTISFRLIGTDEKVLVEDSIDIDVQDDSIKDDDKDDDDDEDEDDKDKQKGKNKGKNKGNTHGLLNALQKHLSKGKMNGGTLRLMELLESRGVNIEEAIEAIEKEIEKGLAGTCEDFETLGKLYKEKHREREVFINGKKAKFDVPPILQDGRTLLPFRQIAESLGAEVEWDGEERKVTVKKEDKTVELYLNQKYAKVNGKKVELDVPAQIYRDRTVIPIRFLAESLDANVDYYPEGSLIVIINK